MATHTSILAWKIPWMEEPGGLQSIGSQKVRHDSAASLSLCQCRRYKKHMFSAWVGKILWRKAWQPTPVFLPGESHGQRNPDGYSPWGRRVKHD